MRPTYLRLALLAVVLWTACAAAIPLAAQSVSTAPATDAGAAPANAANPAGTKPPEPTTVIQFLAQGGNVMWVLLLGSICLVGFTAEGLFTFRVGRLAPTALVARLREAISSGNFQEAWNICSANRCFLSSVVGAGLERIGRGRDAVEFAIEETSVRESTLLRTNITYLSVIGVVAPMVGLTGTVWGMIHAFHTIGENGISNQPQLAENISEVLVATVSGLTLAIPAFIAFYVLRARSQGAILNAESQVYRLLDDIPYEQVTGVRIGEIFSADQAGKTHVGRAGVSQTVSRNVTTNCPACNAPIKVGSSPCPNCGTVLDWST